jgi:diacylglycerol kinase (ATP)
VSLNPRFFAVVNPAAGGGRCGKLAECLLDRVRRLGIEVEKAQTTQSGEAMHLAQHAYEHGFRNFFAVGGDGTAFEIINGLFPHPARTADIDRVTLGLLPLGTGNSFLKDFTTRGVEHTIEALEKGSRRAVDVICLHHNGGDLYFINLLSLGFPANVGDTVNRRFKRLGELGYVFGVFARLAGLEHGKFPYRLNSPNGAPASEEAWDRRPCLFLTFSNSKFTGGKMMIAPKADAADGLIECVRWGPIGRVGLLWNLPRLFTGSHIEHPLASRASATRVDFALNAPVTAMIDGEILHLECRSLEVLPGALDVVV